MRSPFARSPEFLRLVSPADDPSGARSVDLGRIALEIASDAYPELDIDAYLGRIGALADRARHRCTALDRLRQVLGQINWVMFVEEGFRGNVEEYYDPRNSYVNEVLDRKTGIPISLAVVYARVAESFGVTMHGVNTPGHFLLSVREREERDAPPLFVDPFHGGSFLDRAGVAQRIREVVGTDLELDDAALAPCSTATIVSRMLRNLKSIYLQALDLPAALPVLRRLAALHATDAEEQQELAMLCFQLDRPAEAIAPLERLVAADPENEECRRLLVAARREMARRN
ncbi:MAG: transglutaminase-like domain-containing protein [Isosphaeraceae bacterium]